MFGLGPGPQTCSMCSLQVPLRGGWFSQLVETPRRNHTFVVFKQFFYRHTVVSLSFKELWHRCTIKYDSQQYNSCDRSGNEHKGPTCYELSPILPSFPLTFPAPCWHLATSSAPRSLLRPLLYVISLAIFIVTYSFKRSHSVVQAGPQLHSNLLALAHSCWATMPRSLAILNCLVEMKKLKPRTI